MKKLSFVLSILFCVALNMYAQEKVSSTEINVGETVEFALDLKNVAPAANGYQADIYLPEGLSIMKDSLGNFYVKQLYGAGSHTLTVKEQPDGAVRLMLYSVDNTTFADSDGSFIMAWFFADPSMKPGSYNVTLKHQFVSTSLTSQTIDLPDTDYEFIVKGGSNNIAEGEVGTCVWYITADSTLVIAPADGVSGDLPEEGFLDYSDDTPTAPWYNYRDEILYARIESGVNAMSCSAMFYDLYNMISIELSNLNTSNVTNMSNMFTGCQSLTSLNLSNFDTQNVTNVINMFCNCSNLISLDLSSFNTQNVTTFHGMFYQCSSLTSLDLSSFDTRSATSTRHMFDGCSSLTALDVSNFNTQNVTDMCGMFASCSSLTSLDISNFDTQNVIDIGLMFRYCSNLTTLNLTNFNTQSVYEDYKFYTFEDCNKLATIISNNETPSTLKPGTFSYSFTNGGDCTLLVPAGTKALYAAADGWNELGKIEEEAYRNMIFVENGETEAGMEISIPVYMENSNEISAFQFDVTLPEGLELGEDGITLDTLRTTADAHTLSYQEVKDGTYRVLCYSNSLATFSGNEGVVAYINIAAPRTEGEYSITLSGIEMTAPDMKMFTCEDSRSTIYVARSSNDVAYDEFMGMFTKVLEYGDYVAASTFRNEEYAADKYADIREEYENRWYNIFDMSRTSLSIAENAHNDGNMVEHRDECMNLLNKCLDEFYRLEADFHDAIANRDSYAEREETGTCQWTLNHDGNLTIEPTNGSNGKMEDWTATGSAPWNEFADAINNITIAEGVSGIEDGMFKGMPDLRYINWNTTRDTIPEHIFGNDTTNCMIYAVKGVTNERSHNVIIDGKAEKIVLADHVALEIPEAFEASYIYLVRNFKKETTRGQSSGWESIVLPYDVQYAVHETKGKALPYGSVAGTLPIYWLADRTDSGAFGFTTTMKANKPYILAMPNNAAYDEAYNIAGKIAFISYNVTVQKTAEAVPVVANGKEFVPCYETIEAADSIYALNDTTVTLNGKTYAPGSAFVKGTRDVRPFEVYFGMTEASNARLIPVSFDNSADGILEIATAPAGSDAVYDLMGRRVNKAASHGIYIKNGKKVKSEK